MLDSFQLLISFSEQFAPGSSSEVLITSADSRIRVVDGVDLVHKFKGKHEISSSIIFSYKKMHDISSPIKKKEKKKKKLELRISLKRYYDLSYSTATKHMMHQFLHE